MWSNSSSKSSMAASAADLRSAMLLSDANTRSLGFRFPIRADCEKPPLSLPGSPIEYLRLLGILGFSAIHRCDAACGVPILPAAILPVVRW
uniref:Uncharacterized protein n=1 Tax=Arundo donax TaxID=35708 RepID=A0A0A9CWS4_ARUDO